MNEDQLRGTLTKLAGKVQIKFGNFFGNKEQINKGVRKQIMGEAQRSYGKAKEAVKSARRQ